MGQYKEDCFRNLQGIDPFVYEMLLVPSIKHRVGETSLVLERMSYCLQSLEYEDDATHCACFLQAAKATTGKCQTIMARKYSITRAAPLLVRDHE